MRSNSVNIVLLATWDIITNDFVPYKHSSTRRAPSFQGTWSRLLCLFCCNSRHQAALIASVEFGSFKILPEKMKYAHTQYLFHFIHRNKPFWNFLKWNLNNLNIICLSRVCYLADTKSTNMRGSFLVAHRATLLVSYYIFQDFFPCETHKIILHEVRVKPSMVRLNIEKTPKMQKNSVNWNCEILWPFSCFLIFGWIWGEKDT